MMMYMTWIGLRLLRDWTGLVFWSGQVRLYHCLIWLVLFDVTLWDTG